jgi:pimeloyl-ACP methyl ester carboxylesterase
MSIELRKLYDLASEDGHRVPAYLLSPPGPTDGAVLVHGYSGCKEQMLGLAARLADAGFAALCLDLRGHGEHPAPLGSGLLLDVEAGLARLRRWGRTIAIGHSLGGRLALMSSADAVVAISPALPSRPSEEGRQMLLHFGSTAVRAASPYQILHLLQEMGTVSPSSRPRLLVYAKGDIPSLIEGVTRLAASQPGAVLWEIEADQHREAPLSPGIVGYLPRWFNHIDLKFNRELLSGLPSRVWQALNEGTVSPPPRPR